MNFKWDKKYLYWGVTAIVVIVVAILFKEFVGNHEKLFNMISKITKAFMPVIIGFIFAYLLTPIMNYFEKGVYRRFLTFLYKKLSKRTLSEEEEKERVLKIKKISRVFGVLTTILLALLALAGLVTAILPQLIDTIRNIAQNMPAYFKSINDWLTEKLVDYPEIEKVIQENITKLNSNLNDVINTYLIPQLNNILNSFTNIVSGVGTSVAAIFSVIINFFIGIIICVYLLYSKDLFAAQGKKILYGVLKPKNANLVLKNVRYIHKTFGGFITGKIIDSIIIGMIFFVILRILDMPYTVLISVVLGVTNIIPYFGPFIGAIPCGLLILLVSPIQCLYFVIIVLVVQQFDGNVLGPKILGENTGLSSFWVIFALLLGQSIFGFIGLVIGIPLFAILYSMVKSYVTNRLVKKELPADSNYYRELDFFDSDTGEAVILEEYSVKQIAKKEKSEKKDVLSRFKRKKKDNTKK